jgi:hypothetical protein
VFCAHGHSWPFFLSALVCNGTGNADGARHPVGRRKSLPEQGLAAIRCRPENHGGDRGRPGFWPPDWSAAPSAPILRAKSSRTVELRHQS